MSATVIPFPRSPQHISAELASPVSVIHDGDEIWCRRSQMHLGKVLAIVGERVVYASRWGGPKIAPLSDVIGVDELPWQLRP